MTVKCPCCGSDAKTLSASSLEHVPMTASQREIVAMLAKRYPSGMSVDQIADRLYAMNPNGGPDTAHNVVHVQLHRLRKAIEPLGWTAKAKGRHGHDIALQRIASD